MFTLISEKNKKIRFGLPSKGRMYNKTIDLFKKCGLNIEKENRSYLASIEEIPEIEIVFQRQEDIIQGVKTGILSFGICGFDIINEFADIQREIIVIHDALGYGKCSLEVAIPKDWSANSITEMVNGKAYRVASKFPKLSSEFFDKFNIIVEFVKGAGTLEVSPALGLSDFIIDLVSTGQTLEDNNLKRIKNGKILSSEATFFSNPEALEDQKIMEIAKLLLELFEATFRAENYLSINVNMRGQPDQIMPRLFTKKGLKGLDGPTISSVYNQNKQDMFAIHIIVSKLNLINVISNLRELGGSGIIVSKVDLIFENEPERYIQLLQSVNRRAIL